MGEQWLYVQPCKLACLEAQVITGSGLEVTQGLSPW